MSRRRERLACKDAEPLPALARDAMASGRAELMADFLEDAPRACRHWNRASIPQLLRTLAMKVPVRPRAGRRRAIAILGKRRPARSTSIFPKPKSGWTSAGTFCASRRP